MRLFVTRRGFRLVDQVAISYRVGPCRWALAQRHSPVPHFHRYEVAEFDVLRWLFNLSQRALLFEFLEGVGGLVSHANLMWWRRLKEFMIQEAAFVSECKRFLPHTWALRIVKGWLSVRTHPTVTEQRHLVSRSELCPSVCMLYELEWANHVSENLVFWIKRMRSQEAINSNFKN